MSILGKVLAVMSERAGIFVAAAGVLGLALKMSDSVAPFGDKLVCFGIIILGLLLLFGGNYFKRRL